MELIDDKALLRLNILLLATGYLEKGVFYFTKVAENNKETNKYDKKAETLFNSKGKS